MTDWLQILRDQRAQARKMTADVPKLLANESFTPEQARTLFQALDKQAGFAESLRKVLETAGYEPDVVKSAEELESVYVDLAASVGEKLRRVPGH